MRKFGIAAVMVFVLAFAGAALASGGSNESSGFGRSGPTIALSGTTVQFKLVDLGDAGFSLGDQTVFADDLVAKVSGEPAGVDGGVCTVVRVADAAAQSGTEQCQVTYSLKAGQVTAQGLVTVTNGGLTGTQVAAITGGTGRYRNAHGEVTLQFVSPGEVKISLTIRA